MKGGATTQTSTRGTNHDHQQPNPRVIVPLQRLTHNLRLTPQSSQGTTVGRSDTLCIWSKARGHRGSFVAERGLPVLTAVEHPEDVHHELTGGLVDL
jgi:hypothetical protein